MEMRRTRKSEVERTRVKTRLKYILVNPLPPVGEKEEEEEEEVVEFGEEGEERDLRSGWR